MKRSAFFLWLCLISGCTSLHYGNFTKISATGLHQMAMDSVRQLVLLYPPAKTKFCLSLSVLDAFGSELIKRLRHQGYGVIESRCSREVTRFNYVVDELLKGSLIRVSLFVQGKVISRAYSIENNTLRSVSAWSYRR